MFCYNTEAMQRTCIGTGEMTCIAFIVVLVPGKAHPAQPHQCTRRIGVLMWRTERWRSICADYFLIRVHVVASRRAILAAMNKTAVCGRSAAASVR